MKHLLLAATATASAAFASPVFAAATPAPSCHFEAGFTGGAFMTGDYQVAQRDYTHGLREFLASPFYVTLVESGMDHRVSLTTTVSYFHAGQTVAHLVEKTIYPLTYSIVKHRYLAELNPLKIANCTSGVCDFYATYAFAFEVDGKELPVADTGAAALAIDLTKAPGYCQFPAPDEP